MIARPRSVRPSRPVVSPDEVDLFDRATVLYLHGHPEAARELLVRYLRLEPDDEHARSLLAKLDETRPVQHST